MEGAIVVGGSVAQKPGYGGHTWVFLQYLLGFRRLGWEVLFLDWLSSDMCHDAGGFASEPGDSENLRYLVAVMDRFGLTEDFCLMDDDGRVLAGCSRAETIARLNRSAALVNVMGFIRDPELLEAAARRVFLDIDPGLGQRWYELGLYDPFGDHDIFVTIGERIGQQGCEIPTCGRDWITTPHPVVLEEWEVTPVTGRMITSVASWRGGDGTVEYRGKTYGDRVHEFRRFFGLPGMTGHDYELALAIDPVETKDLEQLAENGWRLTDPQLVAGDPDSYRDYVRSSAAELMIAKSRVTATRLGWFSDRSMCYLASGRPVIAHDTGISDLYPTGAGLLTFTSPEEAAAATHAVFADFEHHAAAARALAEERFDSDKVLTRLLEKLEIR